MTPERVQRLRSVLAKRQPNLTILTDYVHKGRNLSAIIRTADAVGISNVHCVIGDSDYRRFRGTSKGSHSWVDVHRYRELKLPVESLKAQGYQIVAAHLSPTAVDFHEVDYTKPTALMLGAERVGISEQGEAFADVHVTVPMVGMVESFNVSVAAGIILTEARHQRQQAGMYDKQQIDQATYNRLFFEWGHPQVSDYCLANNLAYPPLRDDGEIDNPTAWYAQVRELLATR
ncbi:MAG: tRNA (guanosine-2'-O-)-methyltransferase [Pseudohongiellaceae bacterium]|jgi:tRNA (guanosine-2'-O-)-methyltransferase